MSASPRATFAMRSEPGIVVIEAYGDVDAEQARQLLEMALSVVAADHAVAIDLERVDSLTVEAAAVLLFRGDATELPVESITLRTGGRLAREAVLQAYARRRVRQAQV